eukprot:TRINITY_DN5532_c0_g1_i1.p1 TRINITY_DN5532_c0_g1~~TRINITY_DN5532_c0_g1_i1.p1  ORF type:complete len:287 (-),score=25.19 TRINITY_DN5532_c0_g1_i1:386-1246(-)
MQVVYDFVYQQGSAHEAVVKTFIYFPDQGESNGHLIIIANGAQVEAAEYSALSFKFAASGYHVLVVDYRVDRKKELPFLNNTGKPAMTTLPNMNVLCAILHALVEDQIQTDLPKLQFKDVILFGHSMGGVISLLSATKTPFPETSKSSQKGFNEKYLLLQPDGIWDEYVVGIVLFEGWSDRDLLIPESQFLVVIGSKYWEHHIKRCIKQCGEEYKIGFHVLENANHYLVTNYYDEKQVTPCANIVKGQEDFVTTKQEWEAGQQFLVSIVDAEIRSRLGKDFYSTIV